MTTYISRGEAKKSQFISIPSYEEKVVELIEEKIQRVQESYDPYDLEIPDYRNNPTAALKELLLEIKLLNN